MADTNISGEFGRLETMGARVWACIGVVIALGWPFARLIAGRPPGKHLTTARSDISTIVVEWTITLILALIAFGVQRWRPAALGLRSLSWNQVLLAIAGATTAMVLAGAVSSQVATPKINLHELAAVPFGIRLVLVVTAGICEEFIFRGFAIEQIGALTGSRWLGAALSLASFGLGHYGTYGMSSAILIPTTIGLVITGLYMYSRNLSTCMLVHFGIDALSVLIVPALQR
ncbi:MAG TPA: CPBP family intramembrane glutamic endopeptidase [Candidatus Acidoferrales bacterium]|nr:CPBP family intramembrane glutamic endopeptidase [Candidatus Acidoferrales bacterium]